jgi:hypothetical protein
LFPSNTVLDFLPPRKLSDPYVHAGSRTERGVSRKGRNTAKIFSNGRTGELDDRLPGGGLLVSHAVFVHLESSEARVAPVAGLLWLALLILRGVIVHFELFRPSRLFPSNTVLDFAPPRKLSDPSIPAGSPNERGAELAEGLPLQVCVVFSQPAWRRHAKIKPPAFGHGAMRPRTAPMFSSSLATDRVLAAGIGTRRHRTGGGSRQCALGPAS